MVYFDIFIERYGWLGLVLTVLILTTFIWQTAFCLRNFGRIPGYRSSRRKSRLDAEPPVSVVVPLFSEDMNYIDNSLPLLLAQQHPQFQIVIVYIGSDSDFYADLLAHQSRYANLSVTKIESRFHISVKMALNVGIKSARYEHIVLTTSDAVPASPNWLSMMAKGFTKAEIVLGYCGIEPGKGFARWAMRVSRMMDSAMWIAAAIRRRPYRGIRHNLGITKNLYFGSNGFNRLNMNIGEDDLYMQSIMRRNNVCVMVSPHALVTEHPWGGLGWWIDSLRHFGAAVAYYPVRVKRYLCSEPLNRIIFFASSVAALVMMPDEFRYAVAALVAVRFIIVFTVVRRMAKRMGEDKIMGRYFIYDLLSPLCDFAVRIAMLRKDPSVWR